MVKQYCVCGCSKSAVSGKRSWHILSNQLSNQSMAQGLTQMHSAFVLGILKNLNMMYLNMKTIS